MPEIQPVLFFFAAVAVFAWFVRLLVRHVDQAAGAAAQSHVLALTERERCERLLADCRAARDECRSAAAVALDAMSDAEDAAEFAADAADGPEDDYEDNEGDAWRG
jgi:hypothetical protein